METIPSLASAWEAARRGDAAAHDELSRLASEIATRELAARRVSGHDAEDLVQETVRSFLEYLGGENEAPREIRGFLKWRTLGVLSDHRKRRRSRDMETHPEVVPEPAVEGGGPVAAAMAEQVRAALADCRARLAENARAILSLRYEGGLDVAVIAEKLGVSRNAIHLRTFRALAALRECLAKKGVAPEDAP